MIQGVVIGEVWATRKAEGLSGRKLVLVAARGQAGLEDRVVAAIDTLDARVGDEVTVAFGSGARNVLAPGPDNRHVLADCAVALIVDGQSGQDEGA
jgi:ethanolamine utilization protein EutN